MSFDRRQQNFFRVNDAESTVRNTLMAVAGFAGIGATLALLIRWKCWTQETVYPEPSTMGHMLKNSICFHIGIVRRWQRVMWGNKWEIGGKKTFLRRVKEFEYLIFFSTVGNSERTFKFLLHYPQLLFNVQNTYFIFYNKSIKKCTLFLCTVNIHL